MISVILDTSPLVAAINPNDTYHDWVISQLSQITPPFITCEAVISEACFLSHGRAKHVEAILRWMNNDSIAITCILEKEKNIIQQYMLKYANVPMSFADACLVRMVELHPTSSVFTLDSDFHIYRKHGNQPIPLIIPSIH